jgi:hypothetical protein
MAGRADDQGVMFGAKPGRCTSKSEPCASRAGQECDSLTPWTLAIGQGNDWPSMRFFLPPANAGERL